jgi:glutamate racemase
MACGTSSSLAYPVLKDAYPIEIISLIEPGAAAAISSTRNNKIGVIATSATINSGSYEQEIKTQGPEIEVFSQACPLFVPLVEKGLVDTDDTKKVAKEYLKPLLEEGIDTLVLGCTHYPHLSDLLQSLAGPDVVLVDPAQSTVELARQTLKKAGTIRTKGDRPKYEYFVTGPVMPFEEIGSRLLGKPIVSAHQVKLQ